MKKRFLFIPFVLLLSLLYVSCEREISFENGNDPNNPANGSVSGTSVFTFDGGTSNCTGAIMSGTITAGVALTAANTVELQVNVTTVGTYIITSSTVNGVTFSGSGEFDSTGVQSITLTGAGTPVNPGTFNLALGSAGCRFSITVIDLSSIPAVFTLGGAPAACTGFTLGGFYTAGAAVASDNSITFQVNVTTAGTYSLSTTTVNGITFSGNGIFSTTGTQNVTLKASGTPTASGSYDFSVTQGSGTCTFSVPVAAPASFTLSGAPGACTLATVAGTYEASAALGSANTVTIEVNVATAGGYAIATNTVNGMSFSASGSFGTTGIQNVVLTGSGTPAAAGTFTFNPQFGTSGCTFDVVVTAAPVPSTDYLRVKIDGVLKTFNVNLDGDITPLFLPYTVVVEGDNAAGSDEHIDVTVQSATPITPGTYLQGLGVTFSTSRYYDPVSTQGWQAGDPSSPPLKVVITSISATRVTGKFSGQFFDFNGTGTNSKQLTEGEFSVPLP